MTVVVELMARFDEQTNINWAARLEEAGAHVSYGVVGYKTHAKMALVLRREQGDIRRYAHLGTGNYHPRTARLYTDFGLLTANQAIGADMEQVFSQLTGLGTKPISHLSVSGTFYLLETLMSYIVQDFEHYKAGCKSIVMA